MEQRKIIRELEKRLKLALEHYLIVQQIKGITVLKIEMSNIRTLAEAKVVIYTIFGQTNTIDFEFLYERNLNYVGIVGIRSIIGYNENYKKILENIATRYAKKVIILDDSAKIKNLVSKIKKINIDTTISFLSYVKSSPIEDLIDVLFSFSMYLPNICYSINEENSYANKIVVSRARLQGSLFLSNYLSIAGLIIKDNKICVSDNNNIIVYENINNIIVDWGNILDFMCEKFPYEAPIIDSFALLCEVLNIKDFALLDNRIALYNSIQKRLK